MINYYMESNKINQIKIVPIALSVLMSMANPLQAKEETIGVELTKNSWVHYDTDKVSITASTITPIGFLEIEAGKEKGDSKIFSELSIGGFGHVSQNPWLSYKAKQWSLKYGLEHEINNQARITLGIGLGEYHGKNNEEIAGFKDIRTSIWGIKSKIENENYKLSLNYKNKQFNPTQLHSLAVSPIPLEQETNTQEHFIEAQFDSPYLNIQTNWITGEKKDEYSMLLSKNNLSFSGGEIFIIGKQQHEDHTLSIGPIFTIGSQEGSINELDYKNSLAGIIAKYSDNQYETSMQYTNTKSDSLEYHPEFSLDEQIKREKFKFQLNKYMTNKKEKLDWSFSASYMDENQKGDFTFSDPTLAFITHGITHENEKQTKLLELDFYKQFNKSFSVGVNLQTIDVKGNFYGLNESLDESGTKVMFRIENQF